MSEWGERRVGVMYLVASERFKASLNPSLRQLPSPAKVKRGSGQSNSRVSGKDGGVTWKLETDLGVLLCSP